VRLGRATAGAASSVPTEPDFEGGENRGEWRIWRRRQRFFYGSDKSFFSGETILDLTVGIPPRYHSAWMFRPKTIQQYKSGIFHIKEIHA